MLLLQPWKNSAQIICIVLGRVFKEPRSYPHIHLLTSRVECVNLCFHVNVCMYRHLMHLYTTNTQWELAALKLNLTSNVRFLKHCLAFDSENCGCTYIQQNYLCHTLLKVCPLLPTTPQTKKKHPCPAASRTQRTHGKTLDLKQPERSDHQQL